MSTVLANPVEMIANGAPRVIHNDAELQAYTDALFQLTARENPSRYEAEAIELLTLLVERYEQEHYPIPTADPVSVVRFLIEQQNLTQCDLIPQFGFRERGFEFHDRTAGPHLRTGAEIEHSVQTSR